MIGYLDTSALVPLLVTEPGSPSCRRFWDDADTVVSSRLTYVEAAAALAHAHRLGRLTDQAHRDSLDLLDRLWAEVEIAEIDETLALRAAELADRFALRGYDAVHCASAEQMDDDDLVAVSGDKRLLTAWSQLGLSVFDTNTTEP